MCRDAARPRPVERCDRVPNTRAARPVMHSWAKGKPDLRLVRTAIAVRPLSSEKGGREFKERASSSPPAVSVWRNSCCRPSRVRSPNAPIRSAQYSPSSRPQKASNARSRQLRHAATNERTPTATSHIVPITHPDGLYGIQEINYLARCDGTPSRRSTRPNTTVLSATGAFSRLVSFSPADRVALFPVDARCLPGS